jgi:hypothetical protein
MLGKLVTYLRMCGYDAVYALDLGVDGDDRLLSLAAEHDRVLLTRDVQLAQRAERSLLIEAKDVTEQLRELLAAGFDLELSDDPERCSTCNAPLGRVDEDEPTPEYAPDPAVQPVWRCPDCGQHFWVGSHWHDVEETLASL